MKKIIILTVISFFLGNTFSFGENQKDINNQDTKISPYGTYDKLYYYAAKTCEGTIAVGVPAAKVFDCFANEIVNPVNYQNGSITGTIPYIYAGGYKGYAEAMEEGNKLGSAGVEIALQSFYVGMTAIAGECRRTGIIQTKESVAGFLYGIEPPKKVTPSK